MANFIRENIAKREMLAGKKEVIPIETKPSWELLAALYPDISVREAPAHETHVSLRTEGAKWADGELFSPPSFYSWSWNQPMIQKPRKLTHRSQHCLEETVLVFSSILPDTDTNPQTSQGLQSWSWTSPERCCRWRKGFHHLCWQLCGAHGSNNFLFSLEDFK